MHSSNLVVNTHRMRLKPCTYCIVSFVIGMSTNLERNVPPPSSHRWVTSFACNSTAVSIGNNPQNAARELESLSMDACVCVCGEEQPLKISEELQHLWSHPPPVLNVYAQYHLESELDQHLTPLIQKLSNSWCETWNKTLCTTRQWILCQ